MVIPIFYFNCFSDKKGDKDVDDDKDKDTEKKAAEKTEVSSLRLLFYFIFFWGDTPHQHNRGAEMDEIANCYTKHEHLCPRIVPAQCVHKLIFCCKIRH